MLTLQCPKEYGDKASNSAFYSPGWPIKSSGWSIVVCHLGVLESSKRC